MASIKKRGKHLLAEIQASADQLVFLTSDLSLLADIWELATNLQSTVTGLQTDLSGLKKNEFGPALANSEALAILEELADSDAISTLEHRLFAAQADQDQNAIGEFLQQMLEKIEKRYVRLLNSIQQLTALTDGEDSG